MEPQTTIPFEHAVRTNDVAKVKSHLATNPELAELGQGQPIRTAATYGHVDMVTALLEHGADPNSQAPRTGATPLLLAECGGHDDVAMILRSHGAEEPNEEARVSINARRLPSCTGSAEGTRLLRAALQGDAMTVKTLLAADRNLAHVRADRTDATALHYASEHGHVEVARLLLANGADVNAQTGFDESPLSWAFRVGQYAIAEMLEEAGGMQLP